MSGLASDLAGKHVTLPTITSADPPQQAVNKLSKALEVTLPSNFCEITLVRSSDLATVRRGVKAFDGLTLILPLVTIALIALSLWLSVNRRRTFAGARGGGRRARWSPGSLLTQLVSSWQAPSSPGSCSGS